MSANRALKGIGVGRFILHFSIYRWVFLGLLLAMTLVGCRSSKPNPRLDMIVHDAYSDPSRQVRVGRDGTLAILRNVWFQDYKRNRSVLTQVDRWMIVGPDDIRRLLADENYMAKMQKIYCDGVKSAPKRGFVLYGVQLFEPMCPEDKPANRKFIVPFDRISPNVTDDDLPIEHGPWRVPENGQLWRPKSHAPMTTYQYAIDDVQYELAIDLDVARANYVEGDVGSYTARIKEDESNDNFWNFVTFPAQIILMPVAILFVFGI